jgi:hypothetical protein
MIGRIGTPTQLKRYTSHKIHLLHQLKELWNAYKTGAESNKPHIKKMIKNKQIELGKFMYKEAKQHPKYKGIFN